MISIPFQPGLWKESQLSVQLHVDADRVSGSMIVDRSSVVHGIFLGAFQPPPPHRSWANRNIFDWEGEKSWQIPGLQFLVIGQTQDFLDITSERTSIQNCLCFRCSVFLSCILFFCPWNLPTRSTLPRCDIKKLWRMSFLLSLWLRSFSTLTCEAIARAFPTWQLVLE